MDLNIKVAIRFAVLFIVAAHSVVNAQIVAQKFIDLKYDSVNIYKITAGKCKFSKFEIVKNGLINECFYFHKSIRLVDSRKLIKVVRSNRSYGNNYPSCSTFDFGVVFFFRGKIVKYFSSSTSCYNVKYSHMVDAHEAKRIDAGSEGAYIYGSFSRKARKKLNSFFRSLDIDLRFV